MCCLNIRSVMEATFNIHLRNFVDAIIITTANLSIYDSKCICLVISSNLLLSIICQWIMSNTASFCFHETLYSL